MHQDFFFIVRYDGDKSGKYFQIKNILPQTRATKKREQKRCISEDTRSFPGKVASFNSFLQEEGSKKLTKVSYALISFMIQTEASRIFVDRNGHLFLSIFDIVLSIFDICFMGRWGILPSE